MSADQLRRSAALMRERAEAAREEWGVERWRAHECEFNAPEQRDNYASNPAWMKNHVATDDVHGSVVMASPWQDTGCVIHAASWHPAVALAVADLLEATADHADATGGHCLCDDQALAVATTYLAEPDTT